jgi:hypothetical protein
MFRMLQSRRSLLMWKIYGRRLDGWINADHPTESIPGDPSTLPVGADPNDADLDFTGTMMPPPDSNAIPLSNDEKTMFARWIDLGCPINTGTGDDANYGWFLDELRPTLTVSSPRPNQIRGPLTEIRVGFADADSGVNVGSLSITADFEVNGAPAGSELKAQGTFVAPGVYSIPLRTPITSLSIQHLTASIAANQGNTNVAVVRFWVDAGFRIVSVAPPVNGQLIARVENLTGATNYTILASEDITKPLAEWTLLPIVSTANESNRVRRSQAQLPSGTTGRLFIRIARTN